MKELKTEAIDRIAKLSTTIRNMIHLFNVGDYGKGLNMLQEVTNGIEWTCETYSGIAVNDKKIRELNEYLFQINEALNARDYILTSDLFEYEIIRILIDISLEITDINYN